MHRSTLLGGLGGLGGSVSAWIGGCVSAGLGSRRRAGGVRRRRRTVRTGVLLVHVSSTSITSNALAPSFVCSSRACTFCWATCGHRTWIVSESTCGHSGASKTNRHGVGLRTKRATTRIVRADVARPARSIQQAAVASERASASAGRWLGKRSKRCESRLAR